MELPRALAPWAPYLDLFPRELALALGPTVQRLSLAVGPLRRHASTGAGDPDGFSGLDRRGPYERLLMSEWLMAEEAPEEFLRRAAMGEHAFLRLARREPAGARASVALFDGGPGQLGSPRIAQLAALIVLARRAAAAGTPFRWGILQFPERGAGPEVTNLGVLRLLAGRTGREVGGGDLDDWRFSFDLEDADDLWLVGGHRLERLTRDWSVSRLLLRDVLEPEAREVEAVVREPGKTERRAQLLLPPASECVRLLRDPFRARTARPEVDPGGMRPVSNLLFTSSGQKLVARAAPDAVAAYPIPNSPTGGAGRPRRFAAPYALSILAVGRVRKTLVGITGGRSAGTLLLVRLGGNPWEIPEEGIEIAAPEFPALDATAPLGLCVPLTGGTQSPWELVCQVGGRIVVLPAIHLMCAEPRDAPIRMRMWSDGAGAVAPVGDGAAYLLRNGVDGWTAARWGSEDFRPFSASGPRALFGFGGSRAHRDYGVIGIEQGNGPWLVTDAEGYYTLSPPRGEEVVGVVSLEMHRGGPGLVLLEKDLRTLSVMCSSWSHRLPRASSEILHVTVNPREPWIAYSTVQGEVTVYSLAHEAVLYRLLEGEE